MNDGQAKIAFLPLPLHASYRRSALQSLYRKMQEEIENLTERVAEQAGQPVLRQVDELVTNLRAAAVVNRPHTPT